MAGTRAVEITVDLHDAWEVWNARIPDDIPDNEVEQWVRDNMSDVDLVSVEESGSASSTVTQVELK